MGRGVTAAELDGDTLWVTNSREATVTPVAVSDIDDVPPPERDIPDGMPQRFDPPAADRALERSLDQNRTITGSVVDCPADAEPREGDTVTCRARIQDEGEPASGTLRVEVQDNAGTQLKYRGKLRGASFVTTVRGETSTTP